MQRGGVGGGMVYGTIRIYVVILFSWFYWVGMISVDRGKKERKRREEKR